MALSADDVLKDLSWARGCFPESALRTARGHGAELAPRLIESLEFVTREPDAVPLSYRLHLCALFLLAEMRVRRAYRPVVDLCRLTDEHLDGLLGDVQTDGLAEVLASVAQEDDALLRELVGAESLSPCVPVAALRAMAICAVERVVDRGGLVSYLSDLLRGDLVPRCRSVLLDEAACIAVDLGLEPCMTESLGAFDEGLVRAAVLPRQEIVDAIRRAPAPFVPRGPQRYGFITSAIEELRRFRSMWETVG